MTFRTALRWLGGQVGRRDLIVAVGLAALCWGVGQYSPELAAVVGGSVLLYLGLFWSGRGPGANESEGK